MADEELDALLAEQVAYYRARAGEYDATYPLDEAADAFWALVAGCLAPGGRVFVIDELPAVAALEHPASYEPASAVHRRLTTGRSYLAVKVLHTPDDLRWRLTALGWDAEIRTVGTRFFCATVRGLGR